MPRTQSQRALARRAVPQEHRLPEAARLRTRVAHAGLATLAVSVLGLGVAVSGLSTSSAQDVHAAVSSPTVVTTVAPVVTTVAPDVRQPSAFQRDASTISRSSFRAALTTPSQADGLAPGTLAQAAEAAAEAGQVDPHAAKARTALLKAENAAADKRAEKLEKKLERKRAAAKKKAEAAKRALGKSTMPVKHYSIAARFGDVGAWARYHTGFDFSAPVGTTIYAPTAGVVVRAGSGGEAGGWAGNYVVLKHADGTRTLYAHMSSISVQAGERVTGSTKLGRVGMTGRSFGPHLHFEVYPAGTTPGDVYQATNPQPWLSKLGLKP